MKISSLGHDLTAPFRHTARYLQAVREYRFLADNGVMNRSATGRGGNERQLRQEWLQYQIDRERRELRSNLKSDLKQIKIDLIA